ncbi:MAG: OmpA family protein [Candidatus Riflebacteria bacterium]|nr:OmpA family protein [Candidatus Riflebacteria bacterium]
MNRHTFFFSSKRTMRTVVRFSLKLAGASLIFLCLIMSICEAKSYRVIVGYENEEMEIPLIPGRIILPNGKMPLPSSPQMNTAFPPSANIPTVVPAPNPAPVPTTYIPGKYVDPIMDGLPSDEVTPESLQIALDSIGRVILSGVTFDFDSSNLTADSTPSLEAALVYLQNNPEVRIAIEGHCDTSGDTSLNPAISQARADAVRDWLIDRGIGGSRLRAVGMSDTKPIADNGTEEGRAKNRRVELVKE